MEKHTGYALFLLRMESELLKSREVCIELHDGINEYKHEIIAELFNEGYIDGVSPGKGPYLCSHYRIRQWFRYCIIHRKHKQKMLQKEYKKAIL